MVLALVWSSIDYKWRIIIIYTLVETAAQLVQDAVKLLPKLIGQETVDDGIDRGVDVTDPMRDQCDTDPDLPIINGHEVLEHSKDIDRGVTGQVDDRESDEETRRSTSPLQTVQSLSGEAIRSGIVLVQLILEESGECPDDSDVGDDDEDDREEEEEDRFGPDVQTVHFL